MLKTQMMVEVACTCTFSKVKVCAVPVNGDGKAVSQNENF
jgi:hypothetical protein